MDLITNNDSGFVLNLAYYGEDDEVIFLQSERLMKSGFLNINSEEYGYYYIIYSSRKPYKTGIIETTKEMLSAAPDMMMESMILFFYSGMFLFLAPIVWIVSIGYFGAGVFVGIGGLLFAAATPPLLLFGFPSETAKFNITAELYIFDSEGNIVCHYEKEGFFEQTAGLYYGYNPTKNAAIAFSKLYEEIFEMADIDSSMINQTLMTVGPITESNKEQAMEKINAFFARNETIDRSSVPRQIKARQEI